MGEAADGERRVADGLLRQGHEQLVDRALRAVGDAVESIGETPAYVVTEHVGFDDRPGELPELSGPKDAAGPRTLDQLVDRLV